MTSRGDRTDAAGVPRRVETICREDLLGLFPEAESTFEGLRILPGEEVPEPYHGLLVHEHHMTVTLEAFHGCPVQLTVREVRRSGDDYARRLMLTAGENGPVVLVGIVRIRLQYCTEKVRREIIEAKRPLGRILMENGVLRRIQAEEFVSVDLRNGLGELFGAPTTAHRTYGRLAIIFCDEQPAIELLEIVAPVANAR